MNNLSWEFKAKALNALSPIGIKIGTNGHWYVDQGVELKRGAILQSVTGRGASPTQAIEDHWVQAVDDLKPGEYLVFHAYGTDRMAARWNGFMWESVKEEKAA